MSGSTDGYGERLANHDARLKSAEKELVSLKDDVERTWHRHSKMLHTHEAHLSYLRDDFDKYSKRIEGAIDELSKNLKNLDRGLQLVNNFKYKIIGAIVVMGPITGSIIALIIKAMQ